MGDGASEWSRFCLLDINVNPLMVSGCLSKLVYSLLRDGHVLGVAEMFADKALEGVDGFNMSWCHGESVAHQRCLWLNGTTCVRMNGSWGGAKALRGLLRT